MARKLAALAVLGAAALGLAITCTLAAQKSRTVRDGVFSPAQVARGARVFESICTNCHEIAEFVGDEAYLEEVEGKPLWETFDFISTKMPDDDPGSLRPEEYAAVLAYIFSVYGLPSGDAELAVDQESLEAITIVPPARPGS
jgi:mono/diheme cytochrome c family protein